MPDSRVLQPAILGSAMPPGAALGPLRQPTVSLRPRHTALRSRYLSYGTSQIERRFSLRNSIDPDQVCPVALKIVGVALERYTESFSPGIRFALAVRNDPGGTHGVC